MGLYINPAGTTKEKWLFDHGIQTKWASDLFDQGQEFEPTLYPVCLVENGLFRAAGVCYSQREFEAFSPRPSDTRPRTWFLVEASLLNEVCPDMKDCI